MPNGQKAGDVLGGQPMAHPWMGGAGSIPGVASYYLRSLEEKRASRVGRAQQMLNYLENVRGYTQEQIIKDPQMRKIYAIAHGVTPTRPVGERRGFLGLKGREREAIPAEELPMAQTLGERFPGTAGAKYAPSLTYPQLLQMTQTASQFLAPPESFLSKVTGGQGATLADDAVRLASQWVARSLPMMGFGKDYTKQWKVLYPKHLNLARKSLGLDAMDLGKIDIPEPIEPEQAKKELLKILQEKNPNLTIEDISRKDVLLYMQNNPLGGFVE